MKHLFLPLNYLSGPVLISYLFLPPLSLHSFANPPAPSCQHWLFSPATSNCPRAKKTGKLELFPKLGTAGSEQDTEQLSWEVFNIEADNFQTQRNARSFRLLEHGEFHFNCSPRLPHTHILLMYRTLSKRKEHQTQPIPASGIILLFPSLVLPHQWSSCDWGANFPSYPVASVLPVPTPSFLEGGGIPGGAQDLLLDLHLETTPGRSYGVPGIEPKLDMCKAITLPTALSLWFLYLLPLDLP